MNNLEKDLQDFQDLLLKNIDSEGKLTIFGGLLVVFLGIHCYQFVLDFLKENKIVIKI